ncbi:hypothetical protein Kpol_1031p24 [Vanderwaltozyma polyspora DSM 70294]|uniref:L-type lectin-like domain-containing protein n=1 Tax=Vanderwaltozyma polyspora (strain ATCC 22028 / DSM 70294 / BCRC 21397 / CBS 2163 / NBRC 10782 / NRRL Y-8283 / UCD 57-17) TaxID=436907 RepID=A7THV8_VANPO|nr:uncharacterized protein Kpol_1031p24 [Vanderwaltozyma polyspora DSM 70294]EDO18120.1 hypothetical protein Kpol_1031p24 [Vanderwaltozyma polyspora DSM 70294]
MINYNSKDISPKKAGLATFIVALFILFQIVAQRWSNKRLENELNSSNYFGFTDRNSDISKVFNLDASLSVPFLDKINKFWHVRGETQIRNSEFIRLTKAGSHNTHGVVLSNGIGDNTINDFEILVKFRLSRREASDINNKKNSKSNDMGEGMVFVVTPENDFITKDFTSDAAKEEYMRTSGGVIGHDMTLMGFPRNLPGLALVIDTYQNSKRPTSGAKIPFMDAMLNVDPAKDFYDRDSDGDASTSTSLKLNDHHIQLNDSIMDGDITTMRIIYLESISFLKVDIKYKSEGDYWIELFHATEDVFIPKNAKTGQRFIGIGAVNGIATENVDILDVQTNEFHWDDHDESSEESYDYVKEVQKYLSQEYGQMISMEMDEYKRWKMIKAQPNYQTTRAVVSGGFSFVSLILRTIVFFILLGIAYLASMFIKIGPSKDLINDRRFQKRAGVLPP